MKKSTTLNFLDALFGNLNCCLSSKRTVSKSNFLRFDIRTILPFAFMVMMLNNFALTAQNLPGTVLVQNPNGGFAIDGDAYANFPTTDIGDWFYNSLYPGSGGSLFNSDGTVTDATRTFFLQDDWGSADGTTFLTSSKIDDNPNSYLWGPSNNLLAKNDMQNVGAHFAFAGPNETGDLWCIFAADRQEVNGDAYIDFEFLQKPLTKTGITSGGFASEGTDGGRTVGDILVTLIFTNGGTSAIVEIRVWEAVTKGFEYVHHPNSEFNGSIFVTNNLDITNVPFEVYGTTPGVYQPNQWAEGAINLSDLLNFGENPCTQIATLFVRTKTSQATPAELKDFPIGPIQLSLNLIPTASAVATNAKCYDGNGSVDLTISGGTQPYAVTWTKVGDPSFTASTEDLLSVPAGTYNWVVKDANDCDPSGSVTIGQPDALDLVLTPTNATCYGAAKSISAAVTGTPLSDLEINIDGGTFAAVTASPVVFSNLTAANHIIILRRISDNTCLVTRDVTLTEPDALDLVLTPTNATCYGGAKSISAAVTGTPLSDLEINIDGGTFAAVTASPVVFNSLTAANHIIILRRISDNACLVTKDVTLTEPDALDLVLTPTNATCYGGAKSISAAVTGTPLSDLEINIDGGVFAAVTASPVVFNSLTATNHIIILRRISDNTCLVTRDVTLTEPDALDLVLTPTNATCYGGGNSISAAVTGTSLSDLEINIDGGAFAAVTASPVVFNSLTAANHIIILRRISDNACLVTRDVTLTEPDALDLVLTPTNAACYGGANSISAAVTGTPLSDLEINIDGGAFATVTASPVVFNSLTAANHIIILRRISDNACLVTRDVTLTEPSEVILGLTSLPENCANTATGSIEATFSGGTGVYNVSIDGGDFTEQVSPYTFANLSAGLHTVLVKDANGCEDTMEINVDLIPCVNAHCTYTQGYYGNLGGMSCADGKSYTTLELISKALMSYPSGTMRIGLTGNSVLVSNTDADKNAILAVLPGGGNSYKLLAGNPQISALTGSFSSYLTKKGTLNNTLLAQTITLGLNLGIDGTLAGFGLQAGIDENDKPIELATAAPEGGCGSNIPMTRSCSIGEGYGLVVNEYSYFEFPAFVNGMTVQELFDAANTALANGTLPTGATMSTLADAVDMVNNAFDGCRIAIGYGVARLECKTSSAQEFVAFEVPIVNNQLTIKYKFSYVSDVIIDVFDVATGNKVLTKLDTNSYLDKEVKLDYNFNTGTQKVYIVRLTTRLGHDEQKVLSDPY